MSSVRVRTATRLDCGAINDILDHYILHSTATFLTDPMTLEQGRDWFDSHSEAHPITVAELDGQVVGWGALSTFRPRPAYQYSAELSVYIHHDFHRRGIGRAILADLLVRARSIGHHALIGGCCAESEASIGLLESFGFTRVGHFPEVGRKFDRWLDVVFLQLVLTTHPLPPS